MNETETVYGNKVPSSMAQVGISMKYTFLEYIRSRRFLIVLIITLLIAALLTIIVAWRRPAGFLVSNLGFYSSWWGLSVTFVIILTGIFFGGDAISGEFQNKTGYFGIPNPVRRSSIYIGKWISAFLAATAIFFVYTVITLANGFYYSATIAGFGSGLPYQFVYSLLYAWFYLAAVMGVAFFFSSLFKSSSISILVTVILLLFGFSLISTLVSDFVGIEPWFVLTYGAGIIGNILNSPYPPAKTVLTAPIGHSGRTFTTTTFAASVPQGLAIIGVYFIVTAILGLLIFERKEFT
jgi:ABC-2 type transport system permease protein